jgi:hypothetical protein
MEMELWKTPKRQNAMNLRELTKDWRVMGASRRIEFDGASKSNTELDLDGALESDGAL